MLRSYQNTKGNLTGREAPTPPSLELCCCPKPAPAVEPQCALPPLLLLPLSTASASSPRVLPCAPGRASCTLLREQSLITPGPGTRPGSHSGRSPGGGGPQPQHPLCWQLGRWVTVLPEMSQGLADGAPAHPRRQWGAHATLDTLCSLLGQAHVQLLEPTCCPLSAGSSP